MTEREYKEYIEECYNDFNRIAKRLGVEPTDMPINMEFILKLLRAIEKVLDSQPCEDAVSRQEVDELSKELVHTTRDKADFLCNFWEGLQKLSPVTPTRPTEWISVSERLPEKEGTYLLWGKLTDDEDYYCFIGDYDEGCEKFGYWEQQFDLNTLGCLGDEFFEYECVMAWMPLPKPYEPQESEKTETWNGIHAQITAPKGTFERIFNEADEDNDI